MRNTETGRILENFRLLISRMQISDPPISCLQISRLQILSVEISSRPNGSQALDI